MPAVSLRQIARACGVSVATASRALGGHKAVHGETRAAILAAARRQGYDRNALVGQLMSHVRGARAQRFLGNLALIHVPSPGQPRLLPAHRRIIAGARERARALGFHLADFSVSRDGLDAAGYARMLRARGTHGVIFIYTEPTGALADFPWAGFSAIGIDYGQREPLLHTVCLDHYLALSGALARLQAAGYERIGLFLEQFKDERIGHKWSAAFTAFQRASRAIGQVPPLIRPRLAEAEFRRWHRAHRPDLVVGHLDAAVGWLPHRARTDFFSLNWNARTRPCAGLDLRMELQGAVAAETLIAQLQRGERGLPAEPRTIMVKAAWVGGPTLRRET